MSNFLDEVLEKAKKLAKIIVLPEGEDARVVKAASDAQVRGIAKIVLLGDEEEIRKNNPDENLDGVTVINPKTSPKRAEYAKLLYELRKNKGMTEEDAEKLSADNTYFGVLMLKAGDADGLVSGACHSTANTLRPGLQIVKTMPGVPLVSSYFLMIPPKTGNPYVKGGALVFADCGINQNPTSEELAYIAVASEKSARTIAELEPKIAFLSHSSKGSAKHADVDKVRNAVEKLHEIAPEIVADGELQLDAALDPSVARLKAPSSAVAGQANVLIFPDLDAGNIGYKLVERLGGFMAVGPICQGFAKPINDLSRGCKVADIVAAIAITAIQTQN